MLEESPLLWLGFIVLVVILLALDLGVLNRGSHHISVKKALYLTAFWISISIVFGIFVFLEMGEQKGMEYFTGYIIEKAMSVDNLFVFILIFALFKVPDEYQHKALFYGIVGALVFRAVFIFAGAELLERFEVVMYIFGILLIYAAIKTMVKKDDSSGENMFAVKLSKHIKSSKDFDGNKLFTVQNGKKLITPLLLCIIVIEFTDIIFALDSIPAILAITTDTFIVYTSNIFAILGLRSLFFALKGSLESLEYLKYGLGIILIFVGIKLLISNWYEFSILFSLGFIGIVLIITIAISLMMRKKVIPKSNV
ncbi:MAG: TerC family protein [Candidatus Methanomethylophilaceae archaeon]